MLRDVSCGLLKIKNTDKKLLTAFDETIDYFYSCLCRVNNIVIYDLQYLCLERDLKVIPKK